MGDTLQSILAVSSEAERGIIAGLLQGPERAAAMMAIADPRMFVDDCHGTSAREISSMLRDGEPISPITLKARLRLAPAFSSIDPNAYLADLAFFVPASDLEHWAREVRDCWRRRKLLQVGAYINSVASGRGSVDDGIADVMAECDSLTRDNADPVSPSIDAFELWQANVLNRTKAEVFDWAPYGTDLRRFVIGRGRVDLIGAPPAAGKTVFIGQVVFDALRQEQHLRALMVNVEMGMAAQCERQLSRLTGVGADYIRDRTFDAEGEQRLKAGIEVLRDLMPRIEFMAPPFTLERIADRARRFDADICVLDYLQRIDSEVRSSDQRSQCGLAMDACRRLADEDRSVLVVSAVNRSGYDSSSAGLGSYRESSELEYGADSAWLLVREEGSTKTALKAVKNRHGELRDINMLFDGAHQQFTEDRSEYEWPPR